MHVQGMVGDRRAYFCWGLSVLAAPGECVALEAFVVVVIEGLHSRHEAKISSLLSLTTLRAASLSNARVSSV